MTTFTHTPNGYTAIADAAWTLIQKEKIG